MILSKIKAGALQLTMFIVVIIALLLAAFILLIYTHKQFNIQTNFVTETIENSNKGIQYVLQNNTKLQDTVLVNLQDEDYKILKTHHDFWGIFEKAISVSIIKNNTFKKVALVGASQPKKNRTALYLEERNKPLVLVGNTKIQGLTYLPKQGVRTGNISGHSYYGEMLIYGNTKPSNQLPKLNTETLEQIKSILKKTVNINQNQFLDLSKIKTHQNSFLKPVQILYSNSNINLSGVSLTGHIIVQSKTKIVVDATSSLTDVVLIAPIIEIKNHVKSTFQAIATKKIKVGKNCTLNYPSALVLNKTESALKNPSNKNNEEYILIGNNSIVKGVVVYLETTNRKNFKAQIIIEEKSTVIGEVYCNQNLELKGAVFGSVFSSNFVAKQSGSVYQNHIYNGKILIDKLSQEYIGLPFENSKKGIIKWLY